MKKGVINTKYLYKTIENLFFVEIGIVNFVKNKLFSNKETKSKSKKSHKRTYPKLYSKYALLYNVLILISYVLTKSIAVGFTVIGKSIAFISVSCMRKAKASHETICKDNAVSLDENFVVDTSNVIDFQTKLNEKISESSKVLPQ